MAIEPGNIRVAVCGAAGMMGKEVVKAVMDAEGLSLVAAIDHKNSGVDSGTQAGTVSNGIRLETSLADALSRTKPDVVVDFTLPSGLMANLRTAIGLGVSPVVGTTGLSASDLTELESLSDENKRLGIFIAPNFAIGAVLMMQFAEKAAAYMPDVEIIELHHDRKLDSPSGTALLTAQRIGTARASAGVVPLAVQAGLIEKSPGARGARDSNTGDVPVHSVRLPGFVAHQEVIFGAPGQILTIRHDSLDRKSFMPGVILAVRKVVALTGVVIGLEALL